ncbi:ABC transporter substrate-binding protein [Mesorhizobium sp. J18]|uniref:ABC transporter substrate-binding protein n=1 Tax=Mesorhizobium sp. J18 TaxID=935263 RepID=UPI001FED2B40|nr:ABC transporter substrate-binding protein [Mesorhizobium sp. J18]
MVALTLPAAAAPKRVMSLNVCTDQLAMALAGPDQLTSVSFLAGDPDLSVMHKEASAYSKNRGLAEEVFLAQPDMVVTGTYSLHNTTALLKRLDFQVEEFPFTQTLESIPADIRRMGEILGREGRAERMATEFERELQSAENAACEPVPTAIAYDQNGVALGAGTLADSVLKAAGFRNLAAESGIHGMAPFPLELLVSLKPDVVIVPRSLSDAPSLADQIPRHPAIGALKESRIGTFVPRASWACGGPFTIEAVRALRTLRKDVAPCAEKTSALR